MLEIGGDAAIRHCRDRSAWHSLALGAVTLVAYGLVVNANRLIDFGRLPGLYIAVFFVVSQVLSLGDQVEREAGHHTPHRRDHRLVHAGGKATTGRISRRKFAYVMTDRAFVG